MNPLLEDKLRVLSEDEVLLEAIVTLFNEHLDLEKIDIDADDNQKLGEKFRANVEARRLIRKTLTDIHSYKDKKKDLETFNKGK